MGYIALFGIAVETGVVMVVYLHEALDKRLASGKPVFFALMKERALRHGTLRHSQEAAGES